MRVLCINAGSSSVKVALYEVPESNGVGAAAAAAVMAGSSGSAASASGDDEDESNLPPGVTLVTSKSLKQDQDPATTLRQFVEQQEREEGEFAQQQQKDKQKQEGAASSAAAASASAASPSPDAECTLTHPHPIRLVVHRIVHGGSLFHAPTLLDASTIKKLETLNKLAPLHNPPALRWVHATDTALCKHAKAEVKQVAIFDTSFFHALPPVAQAYPLPLDLLKKHQIRRFGFHGLAHEDMLRVVTEQREKRRQQQKQQQGKGKDGSDGDDHPDVEQGGRLVTLQLGSGCSASALLNGAPLDTSMGFSPLEGLMMSTRSGDVDAGLVAYLQEQEPSLSGEDPRAVENMLYHQSGLLGFSGGISSDMRVLEAAAALKSSNKKDQEKAANAQLALDLFVHRVVQRVGAYVATLGGLDSLAFGGGIGEHGAEVRARIVSQLGKCIPSLSLDEKANVAASKAKEGQHRLISTPASKVQVYVVKVDEAAIMLRDALTLTKPHGKKSQL
jgi:acetate kinase